MTMSSTCVAPLKSSPTERGRVYSNMPTDGSLVKSPASGGVPITPQNAPNKRKRQRFAPVQLVMMVGILFCIGDTLYIVTVIDSHHQDGTSSNSSSQNRTPYSVLDTIRRGFHSAEQFLSSGHVQGRLEATKKERETTNDKEPILELLRDAGLDPVSLGNETIAQLPSWDEVTTLYGSEPRFYGLETCQAFRNHSDPAEHFIGVAGTFNTGTNLLADLLMKNCYMPERVKKYGSVNRGMRWQVPYGKYRS